MVNDRATLNYFIAFGILWRASAHTVSVVVLEKATVCIPCLTHIVDEQTMFVWKYIHRNLSTEIIFNGHTIVNTGRFSVERSRGRCDLIIKQARITDAGIFYCEIHGTIRQNITASLTVLASNPRCSIKLNGTEVYPTSNIFLGGDVVRMECSVVYLGDHVPVMQWDQPIQENPTESIHSGTATRVTSTGILRINSSHDGRNFECKTYFDFSSSSSNVSKPARDYNFTCKLSPLNVAYGPSELTVKPDKSVYHPGDEIECHADAKPASKYEWINMDDGNVTLGAVFVVRGSMVRQRGYRFQCKATNEVGSRNITMAAVLNISFMVQHAKTLHPAESTNFVIVLSSTLTAVAVLGAMISCLILALHRRGVFQKCKCHPPSEKDSESISYNKSRSDDGKGSVGSRRLPMAIYAEVRRAEVHEDCGASVRDECSSVGELSTGKNSASQIRHPVTFTGNDGTVYMELNPLKTSQRRGPHHPYAPPSSAPDANKLYAAIDHTMKPPPPYPGVVLPHRKYAKSPKVQTRNLN